MSEWASEIKRIEDSEDEEGERMNETWRRVIRLGLIYLSAKGRITTEQAEQLREIADSGTSEEALERLVEAWMAYEIGNEGARPPNPKVAARLTDLENRVTALERQ